MTDVHAWADQLRQYATHFEMRDWCYDRDASAWRLYLVAENSLRWRLTLAWRSMTREVQDWEREVVSDAGSLPNRIGEAIRSLRRRQHHPDGVLDGGNIITNWEETGEYLQYVQPSVGALLADLMDAYPDLPEVVAIAAEMKRVNEDYGRRIGGGA